MELSVLIHNGSTAQREFASIFATAITMRFACSETPFFANHNGSSAETGFTNNFYAAFTRRFACRANTGPANHNGTSAQTHFVNILHQEDSQRHQRRQRAPQPLLEALGTAPATKTASGTSGDNPRRSPFWRLWVLRLPRGRQPAAPAATTRAAAPSGGSGYCACHEDSQRHPAAPAATTRAAAPSGGSGYCACHEDSQRHQRRQPAPQPLLEALGTAPATKTASGTSGDNPRRSPFWRLWVLRLPRRQPAAPAATTRAAAPSGGSGYCACHEDSQRHQRRQRAPQPLLEALGTAPATRKTASGTSGDNARRSPFWRLWVLRLPRRQPAAPAATTRAAAPSGGSGYCACHEDSQRHQRRQRAPQPLLEALGTVPATKTASGTSGDNPRRSPFWRLWVLRLPQGRQPAAPAATTRAAAPSGGSGYCACHEDSQRHQRRQRAPQPLLEALGTAPVTRKTASGTSGDNACRSPFWRLWVLRLPRGRQPAAPAATTRAAAPSGGSGYTAPATKTASGTSGDNPRRSPFWRLWVLRLPRRQPAAPAATTRAAAPSRGSGYCACHEDSQRHQRRQRAPQSLLEALGTAPATKTASSTSGDNARRSPFWRLWVLRLPQGRQPAAPAATTRAAAPSGGSGYCACHKEDSQRHQRRQRAPQPLLAALGTAPATRKTASGTSGDNPRRSPFWRVLRL